MKFLSVLTLLLVVVLFWGFAPEAHAQLKSISISAVPTAVGDTSYTSFDVPTSCPFYLMDRWGMNYPHNPSFFVENGTSRLRFSPTTVGSYHWIDTILCLQDRHCASSDFSLRIDVQGNGIADTIIRIRPRFFTVDLNADSSLGWWIGEAMPTFNNSKNDTAFISDIRLLIDSTSGISMMSFWNNRVQDTFAVPPALHDAPLRLRFKKYHSSTRQTLSWTAKLLVNVRTGGFDSVYSNDVTFRVHPPVQRSGATLDRDTVRLTGPAGASLLDTLNLKLYGDEAFDSLHGWQFPFNLSTQSSSDTEKKILVSATLSKGAIFTSPLEIHTHHPDHNGDVFLDTLKAILIVSVVADQDSPVWQPTGLLTTNRVEVRGENSDRGLIYTGDTVMESSDHGDTWRTLVPPGLSSRFVGLDSLLFVHGSFDMRYSSDQGLTWFGALKGVGKVLPAEGKFVTFEATNIQRYNNGLLVRARHFYNWGGVYGEYVSTFLTTNLGASWSEVGSSRDHAAQDGSTDSLQILILPHGGYLVYPYYEHLTASMTGRIFRIQTKGVERWSKGVWATTSLSEGAFRDICGLRDGSVVAVSVDRGVYRTTDDGETWEGFNGGLPTKEVTSIFQASDGYGYLGTLHSGIWRTYVKPLPVSSVRILNASDATIFPNPATRQFTYLGTDRTSVVLRCYDQLGREAAHWQVVNGRAVCDVTGVPPGRYWIRSGTQFLQLVISH